ncbi:MAG: endonuclease III [Candidatus Moranbacteria bacterium]|nr:endonuclease III [Candidatus Moranbacteria bacterium]NTW45844.1 endonuclease III [Candidatus Moranbacteria bacterium]
MTLEEKKKRVREALKRLRKAYPVTGPFVEWSNPLELVVGTALSAQCTDERVNIVTRELFKKYRSAKDYADADQGVLEKEIYSTGFYRNKAKNLRGMGRVLVEEFGGKVPETLDGLLKLPGISNKTAYIVLAKAFGKMEGLAVDTHVFRLAPRLGWSTAKTPERMSRELGELFPKGDYLDVNEYLITHGRAVCSPRSPKCGECVLADICPSAGKIL